MYQDLLEPQLKKKFQWIKTGLFKKSLGEEIIGGLPRIDWKVLDMVPQWDAHRRRPQIRSAPGEVVRGNAQDMTNC